MYFWVNDGQNNGCRVSLETPETTVKRFQRTFSRKESWIRGNYSKEKTLSYGNAEDGIVKHMKYVEFDKIFDDFPTFSGDLHTK